MDIESSNTESVIRRSLKEGLNPANTPANAAALSCSSIFAWNADVGAATLRFEQVPSGHFLRRLQTLSDLKAVLNPVDRQQFDNSLVGCLQNGAPINLFLRCQVPDAGEGFLLLRGFHEEPLESPVIRGHVVVLDSLPSEDSRIMDRVREAEEASFAKTQFLANLSHEVRTTLGSILGFSELLSDMNLTRTESQNYAQVIQRNSVELKRLFDNILDLSRIESGEFEPTLSAVNVPDLIAETNRIYLRKAHQKGLKFNVIVDPSIPEVIVSDRTRVHLILGQILDNAIKFTENGEVTLLVTAKKAKAKGVSKLLFVVSDTGTGISEEQQGSIFKPFMPVYNPSIHQSSGTGLGLALSQQLARRLGGDVKLLQSTPGQGSSFEISVQGKSDTLATPEPSAVSKSMDNIKVLLVDDSPDTQMLIQKILARQNVLVETAIDGLEGVTLALEGEYDVVLMDMQMPIVNGIEAVTQLRRKGFDRPIIALTGHVSREFRETCISAGCSDFIPKPVRSEDLVTTLLKAVRNKSPVS